MKKNYVLLVFFSLLSLSNIAQSDLNKILDSIRTNNPTLHAVKLKFTEEELGYRVGITLPNPEVEYEHLFGSNGNDGITEIVVSQSFDFPSKYAIQNKIAKQEIESSKLGFQKFEQEFLLKAKKLCLEIIYLNKELLELEERLNHASITLQSYKEMTKQGETSVVELNKIKLFHLGILNKHERLNLQKNLLQNQLAELNNGVKIELSDTLFPIQNEIAEYEQLLKEYLEKDLEMNVLNKEYELSEKQISLSKTSFLPSFSAGYKMEMAPGEDLNGVVFGLTIPLWEHKNIIKKAKARMLYSQFKIDETKHVKTYELRTDYDNYLLNKKMHEQYQDALKEFNNQQLLDLSLKSGNISVIEYITELSMIYETIDEALTIEKEYHLAVAKLLKFRL